MKESEHERITFNGGKVKEYRDFIPYKQGIRLKQAIKFSFMLDGKSHDLESLSIDSKYTID